MLFLCAVVVGDNRDNSVVKSEYRHTDEAVELEKRTEYVYRKLLAKGVDDEYFVHKIGHHRADSDHKN